MANKILYLVTIGFDDDYETCSEYDICREKEVLPKSILKNQITIPIISHNSHTAKLEIENRYNSDKYPNFHIVKVEKCLDTLFYD